MKKKIERIFLFGDSFVEGQGCYLTYEEKNPCNEGGKHGNELTEWRKKNTWEKYLKKYFSSASVHNYAQQGCDNYTQFFCFNREIRNITSNDLILFGFTSKYRDTSGLVQYAYHLNNHSKSMIDGFLRNDSPLYNRPYAFEKISLKSLYGWDSVDSTYLKEASKQEIEFTKTFLKKHLVQVFDETIHENIAQTNYLFYQEYAKSFNLNVHFFDLFEPYVDPTFNKNLEVDTDVYLTYNNEDLHTYIDQYERENGTYNDKVSYWECGQTQPIINGKIFHPNQHGYELWIDYMYERWLSKWYE